MFVMYFCYVSKVLLIKAVRILFVSTVKCSKRILKDFAGLVRALIMDNAVGNLLQTLKGTQSRGHSDSGNTDSFGHALSLKE